jgi:hypothetical protein
MLKVALMLPAGTVTFGGVIHLAFHTSLQGYQGATRWRSRGKSDRSRDRVTSKH